jgi:hypothetical protein
MNLGLVFTLGFCRDRRGLLGFAWSVPLVLTQRLYF